MLSDSLDQLRAAIRDVPDFPKPGILFKDITPLLSSGPGLRYVVDAMAAAGIASPWSPSTSTFSRARSSGLRRIVCV